MAAAAQPGGYNGEAAAQFEEGSSPHFHPPAIFGGGIFSTCHSTFTISLLLSCVHCFIFCCPTPNRWKWCLEEKTEFVLFRNDRTFTPTRRRAGTNLGQLWQRIGAGESLYLPSVPYNYKNRDAIDSKDVFVSTAFVFAALSLISWGQLWQKIGDSFYLLPALLARVRTIIRAPGTSMIFFKTKCSPFFFFFFEYRSLFNL